MKRRLLLIAAVIALLIAVTLPALPVITSIGTPAGHTAGIVYAGDDPTPTPIPPDPDGECHGGGACGG